jgi:hypothetical protein
MMVLIALDLCIESVSFFLSSISFTRLSFVVKHDKTQFWAPDGMLDWLYDHGPESSQQ